MIPSTNSYDWLGHGIYFWENSYERAWQYALESSKRRDSKIKKPFVIGAIIDLGNCLDLLDTKSINLVRSNYFNMVNSVRELGLDLPTNQPFEENDHYFMKRELDCSVIRFTIETAKECENIQYDSVRGGFLEGKELYPTSGFRTHNHVQLSIINLDCIKGVFLPR